MDNRTGNHPPRMAQEIDDFLLERRIRKVSGRTLRWHEDCLKRFAQFCYQRDTFATKQVTANLLRRFVLDLEETGHNAGGIANIYRSVKAYLNWYDVEYDAQDWRNPAKKVKVSDRQTEPLDPIPIEHFNALLATCERKTLTGDRDRALLMLLMDTGIRKAELTALNIDDINLNDGGILIRQGKGGKPRSVFLGAKARRALSAYLRQREAFLAYQEKQGFEPTKGLWINGTDGAKLKYDGIREILRRRASLAGIPEPGLHSFRRAFAINAYRSGMSVIDIQRILGHTSLAVINRYIKLDNTDTKIAQQQHSVVDNL